MRFYPGLASWAKLGRSCGAWNGRDLPNVFSFEVGFNRSYCEINGKQEAFDLCV